MNARWHDQIMQGLVNGSFSRTEGRSREKHRATVRDGLFGFLILQDSGPCERALMQRRDGRGFQSTLVVPETISPSPAAQSRQAMASTTL